MARSNSINPRRLIAFTAMTGLLLQMAWATAHYPMLLQSLGMTDDGVSVRNLVMCVHRAKQQKILAKLNTNQSHVDHAGHAGHAAIRSIAPDATKTAQVDQSSDDQNAPSDDLCTFSIALTGNDLGSHDADLPLALPQLAVDAKVAFVKAQKTEGKSYLVPQGRAPPA